jgi:sulfur carrier protein
LTHQYRDREGAANAVQGGTGATTMRVRINGTEREVETGCTLTDLLEQLDTAPQRVAVEVNRELVTRKRFDDTVLSEGDTIEIVTFVGGG